MRETQLTRDLRTGGAEIEDGRITINAAGETRLHLSTPRCAPLSTNEPLCRLAFSGEAFSASVEFTARDVDVLIERLEAIRDGEVWDDE